VDAFSLACANSEGQNAAEAVAPVAFRNVRRSSGAIADTVYFPLTPSPLPGGERGIVVNNV